MVTANCSTLIVLDNCYALDSMPELPPPHGWLQIPVKMDFLTKNEWLIDFPNYQSLSGLAWAFWVGDAPDLSQPAARKGKSRNKEENELVLHESV